MTEEDSGTLKVQFVEARLTRDTEMFSKMDPWAQIQSRTQKVRTRTLDGAGKTPKWNQAFDIQVKSLNDDFTLTVFDEDNITSDTVSESIPNFNNRSASPLYKF